MGMTDHFCQTRQIAFLTIFFTAQKTPTSRPRVGAETVGQGNFLLRFPLSTSRLDPAKGPKLRFCLTKTDLQVPR